MTAPDEPPGPFAPDVSGALPIARPLVRDVTILDDATSLATVLAALPRSVRVIRVANPLRGPLTLQRVLIQAGQLDLNLPADTALAGVLAEQAGAESAVLMVIEQSDSLADDVMPALQGAIETQRRHGPTLHVLLVRGPADERLPTPGVHSAPQPTAPIAPATPSLSTAPPVVEAPVAAMSQAAPIAEAGVAPVPAAPARRAKPEPGSMQAVAAQSRTGPPRTSTPPDASGPNRLWLWALLVVLVIALAAAAYVLRARLPF